MEFIHNKEMCTIRTEQEGLSAYVEYEIKSGTLDILHTFVPVQLEGRGIASGLVQYAYDYALEQNLQPAATCSYAVVWLERHPAYKKKAL